MGLSLVLNYPRLILLIKIIKGTKEQNDALKAFKLCDKKNSIFVGPLNAGLKGVTMQSSDYFGCFGREVVLGVILLLGKNKQNYTLLVSMLLGKENNKILYCLFVCKENIIVENKKKCTNVIAL